MLKRFVQTIQAGVVCLIFVATIMCLPTVMLATPVSVQLSVIGWKQMLSIPHHSAASSHQTFSVGN